MAGANYIVLHKDLHTEIKSIIESISGGGWTYAELRRAIENAMMDHSSDGKISFAVSPYKWDDNGFVRAGTALKRETDGLYTTLSTHSLPFDKENYIQIKVSGEGDAEKIANEVLDTNIGLGDVEGSGLVSSNVVDILEDVAGRELGGPGGLETRFNAEFNRLLSESSLDIQRVELIDGRVIATIKSLEGSFRGVLHKPADIINAIADSHLVTSGKDVKIGGTAAIGNIEFTAADANVIQSEIDKWAKGASGSLDQFHRNIKSKLSDNPIEAAVKIIKFREYLKAEGETELLRLLELDKALEDRTLFDAGIGSHAHVRNIDPKSLPLESDEAIIDVMKRATGEEKIRLPLLNEMIPGLRDVEDWGPYSKMGTVRDVSQATGLSVQDIYRSLKIFQGGESIDVRHIDVETLTSPGALSAMGLRESDKFVLSAAIAKGKGGGFRIDKSTAETMYRGLTGYESDKLRGYYTGEKGALPKLMDFLERGYAIRDVSKAGEVTDKALMAADFSDMMQWLGAYGDADFYGEAMNDVERQARAVYSNPSSSIEAKAAATELMDKINKSRNTYLGNIFDPSGRPIQLPKGSMGQLMHEIGGGEKGLERFFGASAEQRLDMVTEWIQADPKGRLERLETAMQGSVERATYLMKNLGKYGVIEAEMVDRAVKHLQGGKVTAAHKFDINWITNALRRTGFRPIEVKGIMDKILNIPRADVSAIWRLMQEIEGDAGKGASLQQLLKDIPELREVLADVIPAGGRAAQIIERHHPSMDIMLAGEALESAFGHGETIDQLLKHIESSTKEFGFDELTRDDMFFTMGATGKTFGETPANLITDYGFDLSTFRELNPGEQTWIQDKHYPIKARSTWSIESMKATEAGGVNVTVADAITGKKTILPFDRASGVRKWISELDVFQGTLEQAQRGGLSAVWMSAIDEAGRMEREALGGVARSGSLIPDVGEWVTSRRYHELVNNMEVLRAMRYAQAKTANVSDIVRTGMIKDIIGDMDEQEWGIRQIQRVHEVIEKSSSIALEKYRPSVSGIIAGALKKNVIKPRLESLITQLGPTPPDHFKRLMADRGQVINVKLEGTFNPNVVIDLEDFGTQYAKSIRRLKLPSDVEEDVLKYVVGERTHMEINPRRGATLAEAAVGMVRKRIQFMERKYDINLQGDDEVGKMLSAGKGTWEPGTTRMVTYDPGVYQKVVGQLVSDLSDTARDPMARRIASAKYTGAAKNLYGLFNNDVRGFTESLKTDEIMQYIVNAVQTGENMPTKEMREAIEGRTLFQHVVKQMDMPTLLDTAKRMRPYNDLDYMGGAIQQMDEELAIRMDIPILPDIRTALPHASITAPLTEIAQKARRLSPAILGVAAGAAIISGMVNKAFVDRMPERSRLKDDTGHLTPDGLVMPGSASAHGELQQPDFTDTSLGEGAGVNMRISGLTSPASAEQLIAAMKNRSGAIRNIRRTKTKIDDQSIHDILGEMI